MSDIKKMTDQQLVTRAVRLDRESKKAKKDLDAAKAELQARGLAMIEDRNTKFVRMYSSAGNVSILDTQSLDILNVDRLRELLTEGVFKAKVTATTETKYKFDARLEQMLKAVFTGDYTFEYTLEEFLSDEMTVKPESRQKALLLKKLAGDYKKDRQTLISVLGYDSEDAAPDFDVELYYIYKIKNGELIRAFLPEEGLDMMIEQLKKCMIVDSKTSITIDYDKD